MDDTDVEEPSGGPVLRTVSAIYNHFWNVVLTGIAIILPVVITLYVVQLAVSFVRKALDPFILFLQYFGIIERFERVEVVSLLIELNVYRFVFDFLTEIIALGILFLIVLVVGSVGHNRYGERIIRYVDLTISSIPGVGTVYKSFRRMGDVMLDDSAENFQDIKLVRCLGDEMYVLGFETSSAPASVEDAADHEEMVTLFIPMAPNPVTGGFLTYVPRENVYDIDMTIEDGVRSILTSGVATGEGATDPGQLTLDDIQNVARVEQLQDALPLQGDDRSK
ncbi:DUF502 domain-containing protein [Haloarchaeobius iranensis]|nr:DUF502 domain-containing protein [Haloarchaeobius iranensis]